MTHSVYFLLIFAVQNCSRCFACFLCHFAADLVLTVKQLGLYMATVCAGLMIHMFGTLMILYIVFTRKNPCIFFVGMLQAFFTAIGTSSRCLES